MLGARALPGRGYRRCDRHVPARARSTHPIIRRLVQQLEAWRKEAICTAASASKLGNHFTVLFEGPAEAELADRAGRDSRSRVSGESGRRSSRIRPTSSRSFSTRGNSSTTSRNRRTWAGGAFDGRIRVPVQGALAEPGRVRARVDARVHARARPQHRAPRRAVLARRRPGRPVRGQRHRAPSERACAAHRALLPLPRLEALVRRTVAPKTPSLAYAQSAVAVQAMFEQAGGAGGRQPARGHRAAVCRLPRRSSATCSSPTPTSRSDSAPEPRTLSTVPPHPELSSGTIRLQPAARCPAEGPGETHSHGTESDPRAADSARRAHRGVRRWAGRRRSSPSAARRGAEPLPATDAGAPTWHPGWHWRRHQLLRHARHRLVRDDDGDLPRAAHRSRSLHPRHAERRPHAADGRARRCIYTTIVQVDVADALRDDCGRGARRMARCRASSPAWPQQKVQIGMGAALLGAARADVHDADEHVPRRRRRARRARREARDRRRRATSSSAR